MICLTPLSSASQREGLLSKAVHKFLLPMPPRHRSRRLQDLATFVHKSGFDVVPCSGGEARRVQVRAPLVTSSDEEASAADFS